MSFLGEQSKSYLPVSECKYGNWSWSLRNMISELASFPWVLFTGGLRWTTKDYMMVSCNWWAKPTAQICPNMTDHYVTYDISQRNAHGWYRSVGISSWLIAFDDVPFLSYGKKACLSHHFDLSQFEPWLPLNSLIFVTPKFRKHLLLSMFYHTSPVGCS